MSCAYEFIANTGDASVVVNCDQRIVLWNDAARTLLGYGAGAALGRQCYELLQGTDTTGCALCRKSCDAQRAVGLGEPVPARDVQITTKAGRRIWVSVTTIGLPSNVEDRPLLAHLFRDVSRRHDLEASYDQLLRRMEEWLPGAPGERVLDRAVPSAREPLTPREQEVLRLLARGASTEQMALRLSIATATVRSHIQRVLEKLGVHSRLEAVALRLRNGLL